MHLKLDEVRRLTGPNLLSDYPGAIVDVFIKGIDAIQVVECWQKHLALLQVQINWQEKSFYRLYEGGASMSISAPMDLLYSACDLAELAWDACVNELVQDAELSIEPRIQDLKASIADEQNPALIEFMQQAQNNNVLCLADDDDISLGGGRFSHTWQVEQLPSPDAINWQQYQSIPVALITGTNGKSTSVRLAAQIAKQEKIQAGVTSTDFIKVGDTIIDEGDYSGPGGARMLIRDKRTEMAFLEVARGGLLRRGLPLNKAKAALVTNVASDHLGQYGINTVDEIAHVKLMVAKAVKQNSTLVLNADDPRLVKFAPQFFKDHLQKEIALPICWFSKDPENLMILKNKSLEMPCVYLQNDDLVYHHYKAKVIADLNEVPMTVNGTAIHNVENALGVIGLTKAMGISDESIRQGLLTFGLDANDNPGRGNLYEVKGKTVIVDFAHNAHSMQAVISMARSMAKSMAESMSATHKKPQIHVMFSHGGDRSNEEIFDVTNAVISLAPTSYILAELEEYLRGRQINEISDLVETHLLSQGIKPSQIHKVTNPYEGAKHAINEAQAGDLILLFALSRRDEIGELLKP